VLEVDKPLHHELHPTIEPVELYAHFRRRSLPRSGAFSGLVGPV
jgi:hypothetical protein